MIQFAQDKAAAEELSLEWITADMRTYQLDEPVDLTISMFDSADALLTNEDIITHFCCVANNLSSRGIYVLDYSHPCDASITRYGRFIYEGQRDGVRVELIWHPDQSFDLPRGLATSTTEMRIHNADREMISFIDQAQERLVTPQEVSLIATLSGVFEVVGWYGASDLTQPLDMSPLSRRMIAVLQKLR
jgi:hypothetical protein